MDTLDTVRKLIIDEFELDPDSVQPDTDLETLGVDSLSLIEFMFQLEDQFKLCMPPERVEVKTLRDIAKVIDAMIAAQHGHPATVATP